MKNSEKAPAKVWRRGQKVSIKWAKNNHRGGLVRFSLVPYELMTSRHWHRVLALYYGCWEQGQYKCRRGECGTDTQGEAFRRDNFEIPAVFPDGIYVLGQVWYGGLHFSREKGQFADYYSCSYIEIRGGAPLARSYQPFWDAGRVDPEFQKDGMCQTSADWVGRCDRVGCPDKPAMWAVARPFKNGRVPPALTRELVQEAVDESEKIRISKIRPGVESGLCHGRVCCHKMCGTCGGANCNQRPGGGDMCCYGKIMASGRTCDKDLAPCANV